PRDALAAPAAMEGRPRGRQCRPPVTRPPRSRRRDRHRPFAGVQRLRGSGRRPDPRRAPRRGPRDRHEAVGRVAAPPRPRAVSRRRRAVPPPTPPATPHPHLVRRPLAPPHTAAPGRPVRRRRPHRRPSARCRERPPERDPPTPTGPRALRPGDPVLDGLGAGARLRGCRRDLVARGLPARHTAHDRTGGPTTGPLNAPEDYGRSPFPKPPQAASPGCRP